MLWRYLTELPPSVLIQMAVCGIYLEYGKLICLIFSDMLLIIRLPWQQVVLSHAGGSIPTFPAPGVTVVAVYRSCF